MSLVPSLLQAILKVDGEALVMHAGEKPYVVAPAGQIELASRGLTLDAVNGIVGQLLPPELQRALDEFGAVQYELPAAPEFPRQHFTVVAARGGDDVWVEIRRRRVPAEDDRVPGDLFPPRSAPAGAVAAVAERPVAVAAPPVAVAGPSVAVAAPPVVAQPAAAPPAIAATVAPAASEPPAVVSPVIAYQETFAGHEAVVHHESLEGREPFVHHEAAALHEAVAHEPAAHEPVVHHEPVDQRDVPAHPAVVARQESVAYQEPVREDEEFVEEEIEDDDLSLGDFGQTEGWYEEEEKEEREIDEDDGLKLPDAEQLFGKRRAAETDFDEEFEGVSELVEGEEYKESEEVEEYEEGEELESGLAVPAPSQPAMAAQVHTPAPRMFIPPPSAVAEVSQPFLLVPPPIVEAPRPLAQMPQRLVAPPPERAVIAALQPAAYVATPVAYVPEPPPTPQPEFVVEESRLVGEALPPAPAFETPAPEFETPEPVAEMPPPVVEAVAAVETPAPEFETPEPVAELPPPVEAVAAFEASTPAFETPEPIAEVPSPELEAPPSYAELPSAAAAPSPAFETPTPVFETPEPVAELPLPVVEAVAAVETPEPLAEVPSAVHEAPSRYAEHLLSVAAQPPAPVFELVAPTFETETVEEEVPPPPVEAFAAHAELPFWVVEAPTPTATMFEPPAESALEPEAEADVEPVAAEPSTSRPSWAARVPPATILSMSRNPIRSTDFQPPPMPDPTMSGLDRLLRVSAARGASTLYLSTDAQPSVRVDGELQTIDGEPVLSARDVESLLLTLMPERSHEALRTGAATEWFCDIDVVGRVRCLSFRDHRGPGGVFRLMPTRSVSVDQLGLPRSVQALAIEPEGLVLVAGPRSSGKRTLLSAFVDQINKTRRDHIITIEREVNIVHEQSSSFVSQREVRGNDDDMLVAARAALREDPDVLVIEDLRTAALMNVALEAASAGRLVVAGFSAHTAAGTIDRIIDLYPSENRGQVQMALADCLRGVIVQVLLRNTSGGRVPVREVLLNTPAVSSVIAEGKTSQLSMAIEGGRRYGMMPINDGLVSLVQSGVVDAREAYRRSNDRPGFLAALKRHGVDTSFVERLA
jgi:twitching motility protein PilT